MKNAKKVFEDPIVELFKILTPEKVKVLDFILTQEKDEAETNKYINEAKYATQTLGSLQLLFGR